jgi:hypothetical protein
MFWWIETEDCVWELALEFKPDMVITLDQHIYDLRYITSEPTNYKDWPPCVTRVFTSSPCDLACSEKPCSKEPCCKNDDSKRPCRSEIERRIEHNFTYHPVKPGQPEKYQEIRGEAKKLALLIADLCPESRERSIALTELESSVFWANASIARNGE